MELKTESKPVVVSTPKTVDYAALRERDRLLTLANVQRMRGQTGDARKTLEEALAISEGLPPRDVAPTWELLGDLYEGDAKWDEALDAFHKAHEIDKTRVAAERKFAALTLRMADMKAEKRLAEAMLRGENVADLMASNALATDRGRRNAGVAMLLSAVIPGFGQFYNGEFVKGAVLLGIFALTMLYGILSGDLDTFVSKAAGSMFPTMPTGRGQNRVASHVSAYSAHPISAFSLFVGLLLIGAWLFSLVDAPFRAAKTSSHEVGATTVDKTGWEV